MEKNVCEKCGKYTYVEKHHVVPRGILKNGETKNLCPNCHTEYHLELDRENLKKEDYTFHWLFFLRWQNSLLTFLILIGIIALYFYANPRQVIYILNNF